jgi:hypothetical protein
MSGILFKPLENFRLPHFGVLWKEIDKQYPTCQEVAPLLPAIERYGAHEDQDQQLQIAFGDIPLPRIWFLDSKGTGLLQVQRDRLLHNWKKNKPTDAYPRYHVVIEKFKEQLGRFEVFVKEHALGAIEALQYEMTYVNRGPGSKSAEIYFSVLYARSTPQFRPPFPVTLYLSPELQSP